MLSYPIDPFLTGAGDGRSDTVAVARFGGVVDGGQAMSRLQVFFASEQAADRIDAFLAGGAHEQQRGRSWVPPVRHCASAEADVAAGAGVATGTGVAASVFTKVSAPVVEGLRKVGPRLGANARSFVDTGNLRRPEQAVGDLPIVTPRWKSESRESSHSRPPSKERSRSLSPGDNFGELLADAVEKRLNSASKHLDYSPYRVADNFQTPASASSSSSWRSAGPIGLSTAWDSPAGHAPRRVPLSSPVHLWPKTWTSASNFPSSPDGTPGPSSLRGADSVDGASPSNSSPKFSFGARRKSHLRFVVPRESPRTPRTARTDDSSDGKLAYLDVESSENGIGQFKAFAKELTSILSVECASSNPYIQALAAHRQALSESHVALDQEVCESLAARLGTQRYDALATLSIDDSGEEAHAHNRGGSKSSSSQPNRGPAAENPVLGSWPPLCIPDSPPCIRSSIGAASEFTPGREDSAWRHTRHRGRDGVDVSVATDRAIEPCQPPQLEDHLAGRRNAARLANDAGPAWRDEAPQVPPVRIRQSRQQDVRCSEQPGSEWVTNVFHRLLGDGI